MTTGQSQKIWKAGVALSDAWLYYAADGVRGEHARKTGYAGAFAHLRSVVESTRDGKLILSALQTAGKAHMEEMESRKPLQDALLETLATEGLMATGYSDARSPVVIEADAIAEAHPDWENSRIRVNGTVYEKVRVTDPTKLNQPKDEAAVAAVASMRVRTSATILEALEILMAQDSGIAAMTRKSAAQRIRDQVGVQYEKGNGFSDPNLARYIRRTCGPKVKRPAEIVPAEQSSNH